VLGSGSNQQCRLAADKPKQIPAELCGTFHSEKNRDSLQYAGEWRCNSVTRISVSQNFRCAGETMSRSITRKPLFAVLLTITLFALSHNSFSQTDWAVTNTFHVGGEGGWDYITADAKTHRLYVTRATHTMVIDSETGKLVADIPGQKRSHGVALVPALNRGFITDGGNGVIIVFDLKTNSVLGKIPALPDADGIIYDESINRLLAVAGDAGALMIIDPGVDPQNGKVESRIDLGGAPEFLAADGTGKAYINLEDKDLVAVVDLNGKKVTERWAVAPGGRPVGMAMDKKNGLLFIGCRNPQKLIVMNASNGKIVADLPIGAGVDATKFDGQEAFASCRDGKLVIVRQTAPGKFEVTQTVATPEGARTMTVDPETHTAYLPTAEFEPSKAGSRPSTKPGTFMILEVRQKQ
jgi:DNA-binding beta-propeller fold protein YncE